MNISYEHYKIFYYVAKYQSITAASKVLLSNQPNVTRTIKKLEESLGCKLFIRKKSGVTLTPEGKKLYGHLSLAFEHILAGEQELEANKNLTSGVISIAASEISLHCLLLPILKQFHNEFPEIRIRIFNHTTPQAIDVLKNNEIDLAFVTTPLGDMEGIESTVLKEVTEIPVCSHIFHPLQKQTLHITDLSNYPLISLGEETNSYSFYSSIFADAGIAYMPDIEVSTADQILPMVHSDLGIGFVPTEFLENDIQSGDLIRLHLKPPIPNRKICMLKRKSVALNIATLKFEQMVIHSATEYPTDTSLNPHNRLP